MALLEGETLLDEVSQSVGAESTEQVTLGWTHSQPGSYRILGSSDRSDSVNESNEGNNQNWRDIYVGFAGARELDSGGATDQAYTTENGYGYMEDSTETNICDDTPAGTQRKDNDGDIIYRFDHLLPGHYYHLDLTFYECDGLGRQETIMVDENLIGEVIDLSDGDVHQVSIRLDPAFYADHNIEVSIQELTGYDAVISEINLIDIDYRYADSGGENDPAYASSTTLAYGWLDGVENTPLGRSPLPEQAH